MLPPLSTPPRAARAGADDCNIMLAVSIVQHAMRLPLLMIESLSRAILC